MAETIKPPPHNSDAELAVLSCMLFDTEGGAKGIINLTEDHFYNPAHRAVFQTMKSLYVNSRPIELIGLSDALKVSGQFEACGGQEMLVSLATHVSTSVHFEHYYAIVEDKRKRRAVIRYAQEIQNTALGDSTLTELLEKVSDMPNLNGERPEKTTAEIFQGSINRMLERFTAKDKTIPGNETGFYDLDYLTGGIKDGEVIFVNARPNVGKSLLVQQICIHFAKRGEQAAYFNYEMNDAQIGDRSLAMALPLDIKKIKYPKQYLNDTDIKNLKASKIYETLNTYLSIFSKTNKTAAEIRARCKELQVKGKPPRVIGVDYIQLMNGTGKDERIVLENNSRALKEIAQEFDCPVLVVSSLSRDGNMRNSGQLDYDSDQIWGMEREHDSPEDIKRLTGILKVSKNRDGGKGTVNLLFREEYLRFENIQKKGRG